MTANAFYSRVLTELLRDGSISSSDSILVVCGSVPDRDVLLEHEFKNVTISNLDDRVAEKALAPFAWSHQDAENLTYADGSFDFVLVHAGLHHCYSPHRALLEMYRVARKGVVVYEARDSATMRLAKRLGFATDYEIEAVSSWEVAGGGVANGAIPNFVYRWTENEVMKTIKSCEPRYVPGVRFFYGLLLPHYRFDRTSRPVHKIILRTLSLGAKLYARVFPKQGNEFAFVIKKGGKLQPWLCEDGGVIAVSVAAVTAMGRSNKAQP